MAGKAPIVVAVRSVKLVNDTYGFRKVCGRSGYATTDGLSCVAVRMGAYRSGLNPSGQFAQIAFATKEPADLSIGGHPGLSIPTGNKEPGTRKVSMTGVTPLDASMSAVVTVALMSITLCSDRG